MAATEERRPRGLGFYAALSLYTHPQSLPEEIATDEATGAPVLSTDLEFIANAQ